MTVFEPAMLPEQIKESLCRELLTEFGIVKIRHRPSQQELTHACLINPDQHSDQDRNPTASLNYEKLTYKCLSADTLIKTKQGERPIGDLAGGVHELMDGNGKWVSAPIREYGTDRLYRVTLSRNGVRKEIYATADHRWYIRPLGQYDQISLKECTTLDLKPRTRIPSVWAMTRTGRTTISPVGVMRGFVYGDGSVTRYGAVANFCGPKDKALLPWFSGFTVTGSEEVRKITAGLPRSWKLERPFLDEGASFLWGWLAGYFAADGCVAEDGHITLSSGSAQDLEFVIAVCDQLGVATYTRSERWRRGISGTRLAVEKSPVYTLSFRGSTLAADFFLIPEHRRRYEEAQQRRTYERTHWWVVSVEKTDRVEPVYCAEVATTSSFVLAGNVLTGNCLGCNAQGGILWLIKEVRRCTHEEARAWLASQTGTGDALMSLSQLLEFYEALYAPKRTGPATFPIYSERALDPWLGVVHPWLTTGVPELKIKGRGIPEQTVRDMKIGWDPKDDTIVIPHFWKDQLVGWQKRRLSGTGPKYLSTEDMPKDQTLYDYDPKRRYAVIVESPMSVLKHRHVMPMEATFGASVTDRQIKLIAAHYERCVLWMDNDKGGWQALEGVGDSPGMIARLEPYCPVWVVNSPFADDPGALPTEIAQMVLEEWTIPASLWSRPNPATLLCPKCAQRVHEGPCAVAEKEEDHAA